MTPLAVGEALKRRSLDRAVHPKRILCSEKHRPGGLSHTDLGALFGADRNADPRWHLCVDARVRQSPSIPTMVVGRRVGRRNGVLDGWPHLLCSAGPARKMGPSGGIAGRPDAARPAGGTL